MADNGKITVASQFRDLDPSQRLAEGLTSGFSRIGMKDRVFSLHHQGKQHFFVRTDGTQLTQLDVVIVGVNPKTSKIYYEGPYVANQDNRAPTCASINGEVPDPGVPIPQAKSCHVCRHNEFLRGDRRGKECQDHRRLAAVLVPTMKTRPPLEAPLLEPVFLKVPPGSFGSFRAYSDELAYKGVHWAAVVTRITFDMERQWQLNFELHQALTDAEAPLIKRLMRSPQTQNLIGTLPEIREIQDTEETPAAAAPALPEETGLLAAFGEDNKKDVSGKVTALPEKRLGRPAGSKNKPKPAAPEAAQEEEAAPSSPAPADAPPWDESDGEFDEAVNKALQQRIGAMMPEK